MKPTDLNTIARWTGGSLIQGTPTDSVGSVSTDTRKIDQGEFFIALDGDRFDAHDHLDQARQKGAAAMLVSKLMADTEQYEGGLVHVSDTLTSLQMMAFHYRRSLADLFVVGVTGSNGKTSTKDFLRGVLEQAGPVNATEGNLNNHIGLPLTVLRTEESHVSGVWEMGMSNPGEIEVLAEIGAPNAAVITNIGTAHIEHMKTQDAIAEEKGMLAESISHEGFVVMPAADPYTASIAARTEAKMITAGIGQGDVQALNVRSDGDGMAFTISAKGETADAWIGAPGEHMVTNALLAVAVGIERGLTLTQCAAGLGAATRTAGRLQRRTVGGVDFLDDSYNANPDSMRAALNTLVTLEAPGRKIAVLGLMAEIGDTAEEAHRGVGEAAVSAGIDELIVVGEVAGWIADGAGDKLPVQRFADHEAAAQYLAESGSSERGDLILVKGSRSAGMEAVIKFFDN